MGKGFGNSMPVIFIREIVGIIFLGTAYAKGKTISFRRYSYYIPVAKDGMVADITAT